MKFRTRTTERRLAKAQGGKGSKAHHKPDPFHKAKMALEAKKEESEQAEQRRLDAKAAVKSKVALRKKKAKLLGKRTRKGQPVMRHMIEHIVSKLQKQ